MSRILNLTGSTLNIYERSQLGQYLQEDSHPIYNVDRKEVPYRSFESLVEAAIKPDFKYGGVSDDRGDDKNSPIIIFVEKTPEINFDFSTVAYDDIIVVSESMLPSLIKKYPNLNFAKPKSPIYYSDTFIGFISEDGILFNKDRLAGYLGITIITDK